MRRLYKKYQLMVWLGLLLICGGIVSTAVIRELGRDLLTAHGANQAVPLAAANLGAALQRDISLAVIGVAGLADDVVLREAASNPDTDRDSLLAHLRLLQHGADTSRYFLILRRDQSYLDGQGVTRVARPDELRGDWDKPGRFTQYAAAVDVTGDPGSTQLLTVRVPLLDADQHCIAIVGVAGPMEAFRRSLIQVSGDGALGVYLIDPNGAIVLADKHSEQSGNIRAIPALQALADTLLKNQQSQRAYTANFDQSSLQLVTAPIIGPGLTLLVLEKPGYHNSNPANEVWSLVQVSALCAGVLTLLAVALAWFWITRYHQHVRNLASRDSMTGLLNRQSFVQSFKEASLEMQRLKLPLSLILFDIDSLKKINETQGHASGDRVIRELARLSRRSVRGSDILCRWGGEQFVLLLKRCELDQAYKIAEQLRLNVQNHQFNHNNRTTPVTISLGVAQWTESETMDDLATRVDEAVGLAKAEGRNRAEISYYVNQ